MPSSGRRPDDPDRGTRRLARADRRAQIIEAAAGAFLQGGFEGTSMEDVASNAGISRLLLYRHFDNKRHLYRAVLSSVTDELAERFQDRNMAEIRRQGGIVRIMLGIARRHADAFRLLWRQAAQEPDFAEFARNFRRVLGRYAEAMIAASGRLTDPTMMRWCSTTLAAHLMDGLCTWLDDGEPSRDDTYVVLQVCGLFAMVDAWGEPHPPEWVLGPATAP